VAGAGVRPPAYDRAAMSTLEVADPLAHRALQALMRAEAVVRRTLATELEREGVSAAGFSALVVLTTAGGSLELKTLRRRLGWSKANATEVTATLEARGLVARRRLPQDRRAAAVDLTDAGYALVERLFPGHADRVHRAFGALDDVEKRSLAEICRKLGA
jgi:MarR family transcriptional regulator, 2-MHQ and catechol-resistance regulon repressor